MMAFTTLTACGFDALDPRGLDQHYPVSDFVAPLISIEPAVGNFADSVSMDVPAAPAFETMQYERTMQPERDSVAVVIGHNAGQSLDSRVLPAFQGAQAELQLTQVACTDREVIEMLMIGRADFGLIGGKLSRREVHAGLRELPIAVELFALSVSPKSDVRSLNRTQLRQIFTGEVTDWAQLGFDGGKIVPVVPSDKRLAERAQHTLMPGDRFSTSCVRVASERQTVDQLLQNRGAIAVLRITDQPREAGQKLIQIEWAPPTPEAFGFGTYPFGIPLQLITSGAPTEQAMSLVEYLRGDGRELLSHSHTFVK